MVKSFKLEDIKLIFLKSQEIAQIISIPFLIEWIFISSINKLAHSNCKFIALQSLVQLPLPKLPSHEPKVRFRYPQFSVFNFKGYAYAWPSFQQPLVCILHCASQIKLTKRSSYTLNFKDSLLVPCIAYNLTTSSIISAVCIVASYSWYCYVATIYIP